MPKPGVCLPRSYWFMRAEAVNSSMPAAMPRRRWESPALRRACLRRLAIGGVLSMVDGRTARQQPGRHRVSGCPFRQWLSDS